ncbi:MAG: hypothetical protein GYB64_04985 [Chloroflexi bacterium]|nr:hypothetical protein [Chloroflexota bacterium]
MRQVLVALAGLLLAACLAGAQKVPTPAAGERVFAGDCSMPCWEGVTPQASNLDDAREQWEPVYGELIMIQREVSDEIRWDAASDPFVESGYALAYHHTPDIVHGIYVFFREGRVTLQQLIDELGEPMFVMRYTFEEPEACGRIGIVFREVGVLAYMPDRQALRLDQFVESAMVTEITSALIEPGDSVARFEWTGEGDYCRAR